ncbi:MAG TPA: site-2 protease family protein [Nocardioidaceae bacterium]|nr:site-2 protease family protein [Nocardioidaceae bacterium]
MTNVLLYTLGVVVFVVGLAISVGLHELGHMIPAKRFGVKVTQYFIGFGNTVWSRKRGETEYGLKALPLGGYVKLVGMLPPGKDGDPTVLRQSSTGFFTQLISDARSAEMEHIKPGDEDRLFYKLPSWKKVIVMAGGPSVNIAIAFFIFWGVFATHGNPRDEVLDPIVANISPCIVPAAQDGRECVTHTPPRPSDDPIAPAHDAGIKNGDRITSFNGTEITDWAQLSTLIRANGAGKAVVGIVRDGVAMSITTKTVVALRPTSAVDDTEIRVGFFGVGPTSRLETGGALYTLGQMGDMTKETVVALASLPVKVWDVAQAIVGIEERDPESPVSIVGGGRFAGETVAHDEFTITEKVVFVLMLLAGFNFFIGMFNFVPLLPLDGGHIAGALYESARRGVARLRGRPDPGFVDVAKLLPLAYASAGFLLIMSVVLIIADFVVPLHLTS